MKVRAIYQTVSFWMCVLIVITNIFVFFVGREMNNQALMELAAWAGATGLIGALSHWVLDWMNRQ